MYSVGTNKSIRSDTFTILKRGFDTIAAISDGNQMMPNMQPLSWKSIDQHRQHIGTMRLIVRKPECLDDGIAERRFKQGTTVIPAPLMMCTWSYSKLRQFVGKA
jgi:hypothetical protein